MQPFYCKISDLNAYFSRLEKDIEELTKTLASIPEDRTYAQSLRESIISEIQKLENHKSSLLNTTIQIEEPLNTLSLPKEEASTNHSNEVSKPAPRKITKENNSQNSNKIKTIRRY